MITDYVKENWESLPKSHFDDLEVVIIHETHHDIGGWGHHSYQGFGVGKEGNAYWLYSSGCSCSGGPSSQDADMKKLVIEDHEVASLKPEDIDFESLAVDFHSYG